MQFVHPYFLLGLLAVSIPIIIHLFNFHRFKKVYFTNVRFIHQLKQETRKRSQLKHLIILLLRILTVAFLVMAFAQPYIPVNQQMADTNRKNLVSVYVDNSFSMEAVTGNVTLFDLARNKARELAGVYRTSDEFLLVTNDFEGRHSRVLTREEFLEQLDEIALSPIHRNFSEIVKRVTDERYKDTDKNQVMYVISDLQKNMFDWPEIPLDSNWQIYVLPLMADQPNNIFIDSCWFESPVQLVFQQTTLKVRIYNFSETDLEKIPVRLSVNSSQKGLANVDIPAGRSIDVEMPYINYDPGVQMGVLSIDDYPVTYDDRFYLSYDASGSIAVLAINQGMENPYLNAVFGKDSTFVFESSFVGSLDYNSFSKYQLICLDGLREISSGLSQELQRFLEDDGSLAVFPGNETDLKSYNAFLNSIGSGTYGTLDTNQTRATYINLDHPFYQDVFEEVPENIDLPVVQKHYPINRAAKTDQEILMGMQNGNTFLSVQSIGKGVVYLCSSGLDDSYSNFHRHAVFVPTLFKMALLSQRQQKLFYTIGGGEVIELRGVIVQGDQTLSISKPGEDFSFIPEHRLADSRTYIYTHDQITEPGTYQLMMNDSLLMGLAYNFDRRESVMEFYSPDEIIGQFNKTGISRVMYINDTQRPFSLVLNELSRGVRLWKWSIALALLCIAGEVLIIRFWKQ